MKSDTTLSETVSALCDVVLLITDINPLRVRGSFIFLMRSLNTIIDFCSVSQTEPLFYNHYVRLC